MKPIYFGKINHEGFIKNLSTGTYVTCNRETGEVYLREKFYISILDKNPTLTQKFHIKQCFQFPYFEIPVISGLAGDSKQYNHVYSIQPIFKDKGKSFLGIKKEIGDKKKIKKPIEITLSPPVADYMDFGSFEKFLWEIKEKDGTYSFIKYELYVEEGSFVVQNSWKKLHLRSKTEELNDGAKWVLEEIGENSENKDFILDKKQFKDTKMFIPSDCCHHIALFVQSPLTLLIIRQLNKQFYIETNRKDVWIQHISEVLKLQHKEEEIAKLKKMKNLVSLYFSKYFIAHNTPERKKNLISNQSILANVDNLFPSFSIKSVYPPRTEEEYSKIREDTNTDFPFEYGNFLGKESNELYCHGCKKIFKTSEVPKEILENVCYSFNGNQYEIKPSHKGYCSKECFNKDLVKIPKSLYQSFDRKALYKKLEDCIFNYYYGGRNSEYLEKAIKKKRASVVIMNSDIVFDQLNRFNIEFGWDESFGGPRISQMYKVPEKKVSSLLDEKNKGYEIGMINVHCWSRMGISFDNNLFYFQYKKFSN